MSRPVGSKNKRTLAYLNKAHMGGELPLDYMLKVMRDEAQPKERRDDMAKAAAPYLHAKLQSVEMKGEIEHNYVARIPAPVHSADQWQQQHQPTNGKLQ